MTYDPEQVNPRSRRRRIRPNLDFSGPDMNPDATRRLTEQIRRVRDLMLDGQWRTLDQIAEVTGDPPASISAQLRNLRKERFGGYRVDKRHVHRGLYTYQIPPGQ